MAKLKRSLVAFEVQGKPVKFYVLHDLPDTPGLRLSDAVSNWVVRTNEFTARSLCDYILSKGTGAICKPVK